MAGGSVIYEYQGVEYELPASYTKEEAKARILKHLGKGKATTTRGKQDVGLLEAAKRGITEDAPYGISTAAKFIGGGLADLVGATDTADRLFSSMDKEAQARELLQQQRAQTENQGLGAKVVQGVVGALPQMLTTHATQAAEDVRKGANTKQALGALGVNTAANLIGAALPAGRGLVKGAAIGAASNPATSVVADQLNKRITAGSGAQQNYQKTGEDYLVEALAGGVMGGALGKLGDTAKPKAPPTSTSDRAKAYTAKKKAEMAGRTPQSAANAKANSAPAPAGTPFELDLVGGKGTRAGAKEFKQQQQQRQQMEEPTVTPEADPNQLDMFVEDNRKVVEQNLAEAEQLQFQEQLAKSQEAEALKSQQLLQQEQGDLFTPQEGITKTAQKLVKEEQENAAWTALRDQQQREREISWQQEIREQAKAYKAEEELTALQDHLNKTASVDYGMGPKTREFIQQQALEHIRSRSKGQQGGFIDPTVFVDGFKAAFNLVRSGVTSAMQFNRKMYDMFGDKIKSYLPQMFNAARKEVQATGLGIVEKYGMPVRDLAMKLKYKGDERLDTILTQLDTAAGGIRDSFRSMHYDEKYQKGLFTSGVAFGDAPFARVLSNKSLEGMLEKYKPYWNSEVPVDPEKLGFTQGELEAFLDLRETLDTVAQQMGIDPSINPNYMPRMRTGNYVVVSRDANGALHVESTDSIKGAAGLRKQLEAEGHTVLKAGTKQDVSGTNDEYHSILTNDFMPRKGTTLRDRFSSHWKEAENVGGYSGQRNTADMVKVLTTYMDRAENSLIKPEYEAVLKEAAKILPDDQYAAVVKYAESSLGMGFLHEAEWIHDGLNAMARQSPILAKAPTVLRGVGQFFNSYKVMPSVQNIIQATTSPVFGLIYLNQQGAGGKLSLPKAWKNVIGATTRSMLMSETPLDRDIANKATRAGYIQNAADVVGSERALQRGPIASAGVEMLKDLSRAGRIELGIRKTFFVGMYNYYLKDVGLSSEKAFHAAGADTRKAFVGIRPEDRALWARSMGPAAPVVASLSTYPIGMAAKLYSSLGASREQLAGLGTILGFSIIAGGLRGTPITDIGEALTMVYDMFAEDEDQLKSFDAFMQEQAKKHPEYAQWINGQISEVTGVDMSRSVGWPGLTNLIPFMEEIKAFVTGQGASRTAPPIHTLGQMVGAAGQVAKDQFGDTPMRPSEREKVAQTLLPRFAQRAMDTPQVYAPTGELQGTISQEATDRGRMLGGRSLEETQLAATEQNLSARSAAITQRHNKALDNLVVSILYEDDPEMKAQKLTQVQQTLAELAAKGVKISASQIKSAVMREIVNTKLTTEQRELISRKFADILLRNVPQEGREDGEVEEPTFGGSATQLD